MVGGVGGLHIRLFPRRSKGAVDDRLRSGWGSLNMPCCLRTGKPYTDTKTRKPVHASAHALLAPKRKAPAAPGGPRPPSPGLRYATVGCHLQKSTQANHTSFHVLSLRVPSAGGQSRYRLLASVVFVAFQLGSRLRGFLRSWRPCISERLSRLTGQAVSLLRWHLVSQCDMSSSKAIEWLWDSHRRAYCYWAADESSWVYGDGSKVPHASATPQAFGSGQSQPYASSPNHVKQTTAE